MSDVQSFWSKVKPAPADECWLWQAAKAGGGYGHVKWNGKVQYAHRVAYQLMIGEIPDGLALDHLCRVRHCVNPYHLDPVTYAVNTARSPLVLTLGQVKSAKTHCPVGHAYTADNLLNKKNGYRECRECNRIRCLRNYHSKKAARS